MREGRGKEKQKQENLWVNVSCLVSERKGKESAAEAIPHHLPWVKQCLTNSRAEGG